MPILFAMLAIATIQSLAIIYVKKFRPPNVGNSIESVYLAWAGVWLIVALLQLASISMGIILPSAGVASTLAIAFSAALISGAKGTSSPGLNP